MKKAGRQLGALVPDTGWVSRRIRSTSDVDGVISLFLLNYQRVAGRRRVSSSESESS
ncbi:MAG: DUF5519 family protein [Actinomycetota bacterium]|nr:DUF5519 family protein [Actinomycetota bacterium]